MPFRHNRPAAVPPHRVGTCRWAGVRERHVITRRLEMVRLPAEQRQQIGRFLERLGAAR